MTTIKNFEQYLKAHKATEAKHHTNTRIGDKKLNIFGGSYTIHPTEWEDFTKNYFNHVFVQGKKEYLTEKQLIEDGPILLDFDFRYEPSITTRQHTEDHIIDIMMLYAENINELVAVRNNVDIDVFVMEKALVNCIDGKTKDGIHMIFGIKMHKALQVVLRDKILDSTLSNMLSDIPLTNDLNDILDEGVTKGISNWQMYGSRKPGNLAYMMKYHYVLNYDERTKDWTYKSNPIEKFSNETYIERLSARYTEHPEFTIKDHVKGDFQAAKDRLTKKDDLKNIIISGLLTPPPEQKPNSNKTDNSDDNEKIEILDNINNKYWTDFTSWKKLIMGINSSFVDKKQVQDLSFEYSKKTLTDNYDEEAILKLLEASHDKINMGTICYYSKLSNKDNFYKIKAKYHVSFDNTDYEIAHTYIKLVGDNIKIADNTPYIYEGRLWAIDTDKKKIQRNIVRTLLEFYEKCNARYAGLIKHTETADANYDKYVKTLKQILELLVSIKGDKKQNNILKQVLLFVEEDKSVSFDKIKPYYFVFNNIAFDMKTGNEVKIDKYDYITQSTGYDYTKPSQEQIDKISSLISEILNHEETRKCYLSVLKSCCVGVRQEKFILANGGGRNGKGIISQLMALMLGKDYFYQGNCTTLTQQIKSGANPEIANMHKKRMVMFSEPEENASLYLGVIKALTGEDTTNARGLYSSNTETALMGTTILEVNGKPNINGKINDSAIERWININFRNLYTDNHEIVDNVRIFKQNTLYKEQEWRLDMRCALFDLLRFVEDNTIIIPKSVRDNTLDYLLDNDSIIKWFNQEYKVVSENGNDHIIKASDLYAHFKEGDFYMNLSKRQKRDEYSKKGFIEKIAENVKLKAFFHDRKKINGMDYKSILTHTIQLTDEEKGEEHEE